LEEKYVHEDELQQRKEGSQDEKFDEVLYLKLFITVEVGEAENYG
jgi:hypothetical protein